MAEMATMAKIINSMGVMKFLAEMNAEKGLASLMVRGLVGTGLKGVSSSQMKKRAMPVRASTAT